ncbi:MAG: LPS translocon maturation chaperone LptM [Burkholderiaceae bacterium]
MTRKPMPPNRLIVLTTVSITLLSSLVLTGCGQRGPLYLPAPGQPQAEELSPVVPKRKSDVPS